jgi:hypothetical protein
MANFVYSITKNIGKESEQRENDVVLQQISSWWGRKLRLRFFHESFRKSFRESFCKSFCKI